MKSRKNPKSTKKDHCSHEWQIKEVKKGIQEAEQGKTISHKLLKAKWKNGSPYRTK